VRIFFAQIPKWKSLIWDAAVPSFLSFRHSVGFLTAKNMKNDDVIDILDDHSELEYPSSPDGDVRYNNGHAEEPQGSDPESKNIFSSYFI
jgi:hypothetical protein